MDCGRQAEASQHFLAPGILLVFTKCGSAEVALLSFLRGS
jgi:hypothetical protein